MTARGKPKRVRWDCPNGEHAGVLGPARPRRDAVVRYCLPCSERLGVLVERVAPALETQRQAAADRARDKARKARERAATRKAREKQAETERYTVDGVDLREEVARLARLRTFGGSKGHLARRVPELTVTRRKQSTRTQRGSALYGEHRIRVALWPGIPLADVRETLVHELAHLHVGPGEGHGDLFKDTMRRAWREAYGPDVIAWTAYHGKYAASLNAARSAN